MHPRDPALHFDVFGGNCPVQAWGWIGAEPFYFRARHEHWSLCIGGDPIMEPEWEYEEAYGNTEHAAGWMPQHEALGFIAKAVGLYANREQP